MMAEAKAFNCIDVSRLMAHWTLLQRVRFVAEELRNLYDIIPPIADIGPGHELSREADALQEIASENFAICIAKCDGDWEPSV